MIEMDLKHSIAHLKKKFGDNIIYAGDEIPDVWRVPIRDLPMFDYVSGGGLMHNRINEFLGENGSLKSWVMYKYLGIYQHIEWSTRTLGLISKIEYNKDSTIKSFSLRRGKKVDGAIARKAALIDVEHTYTPSWGKKLGVDTRGLIVSQPDRLSTAVDIAEMFLSDPLISIVAFDSLSAVGSDEEIDNPMENNQMGVAARFWNKAIRKLQSAMNRNPNGDITLIVINSDYKTMSQYSADEPRNGGQLKRSKSLSIHFRAMKTLTEEVDGVKETVIGRNIVLKCLKNKGGGPTGRRGNFFYAEIDYELSQANHTDYIYQIVELAVKGGIVKRVGNSYIYGDFKLVGMSAIVSKIGKDKEVFNEIRDRVYNEVINVQI